MVDLVARGEVDMAERFDDVNHAAGVNVDSRAAQQAPEEEEVIEEP